MCYNTAMNKLEGFYELNKLSLPTVEWKQYRGQPLNPQILWTVRTAVFTGEDFNLPRLVGATADEATAFAERTRQSVGENGMVVVYPFFVARLSGTLIVNAKNTEIECVLGDLWNLVTHGRADFSAVYGGEGEQRHFGSRQALKDGDVEFLLSSAERIRRYYREDMASGKSVYAEWSFARNCDKSKNPVGDEYPVFYELRTIG